MQLKSGRIGKLAGSAGSTKFSKQSLQDSYPKVKLAFYHNTNLHNTPTMGRGLLCVLRYSSLDHRLGIMLMGGKKEGHFLIWKGNLDALHKITSFRDLDYNVITLHWQPKHIIFDSNFRCFYVNQVFGTRISLKKYPDDSQENILHISSITPDVLRCPMISQLHKNVSKKYFVIYCLDEGKEQRTFYNKKKDENIYSIPIGREVKHSEGLYTIVNFIDIHKDTFVSCKPEMTSSEFLMYFMTNRLSDPYQLFVPSLNVPTRIK